MNKYSIIRTSLIVASLLAAAPGVRAACELPVDRPLKKSSVPRDGFDTAAFINSAVADLGDDLMGYTVLLQGKAGKIIAEASYGYARTPCEEAGQQKFNRQTQTAWGSVTKMITAAAVIDKTERSTNRNLDEKMVDFVPERWRDKVSDGYREVSIRNLLSYQGGFGEEPEDVDPRDYEDRLSHKPERKVGTRKYDNANYGIFHYMGRFFQAGHWDEIEAKFHPGEIDYDSYVFAHGRSIYEKVIQDRIFKPLGIKASCNDSEHNGDNFANFYNNPGNKKGYHLNQQDYSGCATGGIVMSATDMGKFLHALTRTDSLISRENYKSLMEVTPVKNVIGWNGFSAVTGGNAYHKAGGRNLHGNSIPGNTASGRAGADIMAFPNGMTAVIVINSRRTEDMKKLKEILHDAYNSGAGPKVLVSEATLTK